MRASRLWRVISRFRNVLEGSLKAQIEGFDVNFYISNELVYTLDVELLNVLQQSIKAQIEGLGVNFHNVP